MVFEGFCFVVRHIMRAVALRPTIHCLYTTDHSMEPDWASQIGCSLDARKRVECSEKEAGKKRREI